MNEIPQNTLELNPNVFLAQLRQALNSKSAELLRAVVDGIQIGIHGTDETHFSPLSDDDLRVLLETGRAMINVGSGTRGQRIYVKDGELYMPPGNPGIAEYIKEQRMNFKRLFDLPLDLPDSEDLRVKF